MGKRKIVFFISPKKSLEGYLGGLFFCLISGFFLLKIWGEKYWIILSIIVFVFGSLGDLVESTIKRYYNVKDSGVFLPGHGGFLDRLDSFIFVIPIIYILIKLDFIF